MNLAIRGTVNYTLSGADLVKVYLELCEIVVCFAVAIVREFVILTVRIVSFCQKWQEWRWFGRLGPVEIGFNLQQQWDDLEVVWYTWDVKGVGFSLYWCRQDGWAKVSW
jgi:hypothetical protein